MIIWVGAKKKLYSNFETIFVKMRNKIDIPKGYCVGICKLRWKPCKRAEKIDKLLHCKTANINIRPLRIKKIV